MADKKRSWLTEALTGKIRALPMTNSDSQLRRWLKRRLAELAKEHKDNGDG